MYCVSDLYICVVMLMEMATNYDTDNVIKCRKTNVVTGLLSENLSNYNERETKIINIY